MSGVAVAGVSCSGLFSINCGHAATHLRDCAEVSRMWGPTMLNETQSAFRKVQLSDGYNGKKTYRAFRKTQIVNMTETSTDEDHQIYRINNNLCAFSPCGDLFAIAYQSNIVVKRMETFETLRLYVFTDIIEYLEWSPNGQFILCASIKKALAQVYSIDYTEWKWKLTEGSAGMERVTWAPDSLHIITIADLYVQISVWSLDTKHVTYIQNLKTSANRTLTFSPNGKSFAVIVTDDGEDCVEIYKTDGWKISRKLLCEKLCAIDGTSWSPSGELLCIWCSISGQTKLLIYSTASDSHVGAFSPEVSDPSSKANAIQNREFYKVPRGIDKITWNPNGQLLAIAAYHEMVFLLNYITWKPILELRCEPVIKESNYLNKVYRECSSGSGDKNANVGQHTKMEEVNERPINIPIASDINGTTGLFIAAVDIFEFSPCGRYLAIRHQVYSSTIWIWDIQEDSVEHLLLKRPVSGICWSPNASRLVIFTESPLVFEWWAGHRVTCHLSPRGITVLTGRWHPGGKTLALCGYNKTAIMQLDTR